MTAFPRTIMSALGLIFSMLVSLFSGFQTAGTQTDKVPSDIPDDFQPIVQFVAASDSHNMNDRVTEMLSSARKNTANSNYTSIDAALLAGDFTNIGTDEEIENFYTAFTEVCGDSTTPVVCLGNHELKTSNAHSRYTQITGWEPDVHTVINGVHFIAISYDCLGSFGTAKQLWLREQLDEAAAESPDMPIIVIQHPHPSGTVYGSITWGSPQLNNVLDDYSQVIVFSGHSHFPINDPRSVWQGEYTSVGCGGLKYYELELNLTAGHNPEEGASAGNYWLVGIDKNGSVSMRAYDILGEDFYDKASYYIENPCDATSFTYTYNNIKSLDPAPIFPENSVVTTETDADGKTVIFYTAATDDYIVHDYKIKVTLAGLTVFQKTVLSDYYYIDEPDTYSINVGKLISGQKYTVSITACNAFYRLSSPQTYTFTA